MEKSDGSRRLNNLMIYVRGLEEQERERERWERRLALGDAAADDASGNFPESYRYNPSQILLALAYPSRQVANMRLRLSCASTTRFIRPVVRLLDCREITVDYHQRVVVVVEGDAVAVRAESNLDKQPPPL